MSMVVAPKPLIVQLTSFSLKIGYFQKKLSIILGDF